MQDSAHGNEWNVSSGLNDMFLRGRLAATAPTPRMIGVFAVFSKCHLFSKIS